MSKSVKSDSDPEIQITKENIPKRTLRRLHDEVRTSDIAIVGLDYVKEVMTSDANVGYIPFYLCELCDTQVGKWKRGFRNIY